MRKYLQLTAVLFIVAGLSGLIIGSVYTVLKPTIDANREAKVREGIQAIFEETDSYEPVEDLESSNDALSSLYQANDENGNLLGYVFEIDAPGSYSEIVALVGVDTEGNVKGIHYVSFKETTGIGDRVKEADFKNQFIGIDIETFDTVDSIGGATYSSTAVINAVDIALQYYNDNIKE